jgi:UDP-N-acetylglucosamine 2-epimerase (non-hydrolysing)
MRILNVVGARPNFVKIAPLLREMRRHADVVPLLVHTGQHYDGAMSERFFADLEIPAPDFDLGVGSGPHGAQTAEIMKRLEPVLETTRPDRVLVVGDVNSTVAATLTAAKLGIPVAHVEAGLRSFDRTMPEEVNRLVTDTLAEFLFVTEESGVVNLRREGIPPDRIHFVGNVMIDALQMCRPRWSASTILDRLGLSPEQPYAVLTLHRPSNVDDPALLMAWLASLERLAHQVPVVFPVHPRVRQQLLRQTYLSRPVPNTGQPFRRNGIIYLEPLGYLDFVALLSRARLVLTDSGGVQEETTILGVPCLTLRNTTERPVTVTHGTNRIVGDDPERIVDEAQRALTDPLQPPPPPALWDGRAAERIVEILRRDRRVRPQSNGTHSMPHVAKTARGFVVWFTGLPSAGKSTLARGLEKELARDGRRVEVLDGDEVRARLTKGLGFSRADRDENIRRIAYVAGLLARNGVVAVTATISPYRDVRAEIRAEIGDFVEVYVNCPVEECIRRDVKGLYGKALRNEIPNFTGVSDPYEPPANPEIMVETHQEGPEDSLEAILTALERLGFLDRTNGHAADRRA